LAHQKIETLITFVDNFFAGCGSRFLVNQGQVGTIQGQIGTKDKKAVSSQKYKLEPFGYQKMMRLNQGQIGTWYSA